MPTKKSKVASKKTTTSKKSVSAFKGDFTPNIISWILYAWSVLVLIFGIVTIFGVVQSTSTNTGGLLLSYFISIVLFVLAFLTFKIARAISAGNDDGYMGALVSLLNIGIFGLSEMTWDGSIQPVAWGFIAVAVLGLIFLLPAAGKYSKVNSHALATWALVLYVLFWFATIVLVPYAAA